MLLIIVGIYLMFIGILSAWVLLNVTGIGEAMHLPLMFLPDYIGTDPIIGFRRERRAV
jgi:hypothetical protein